MKLWVKLFLGTMWGQEHVCQRYPLWWCGWWQQKWPTIGSDWIHSSANCPEPSRPNLCWTHTYVGLAHSSFVLLVNVLTWRRRMIVTLGKTGRQFKVFEILWCRRGWYGSWQAHVCREFLYLPLVLSAVRDMRETVAGVSSKQWTKRQLGLAESASLPRKLGRLNARYPQYPPPQSSSVVEDRSQNCLSPLAT